MLSSTTTNHKACQEKKKATWPKGGKIKPTETTLENRYEGRSIKGFKTTVLISYDIVYVWNLTNDTNELIYETEIESQA